MRKPAAYLLAILVGAIIWFFFQHFTFDGLQSVRVVPKEQQPEGIADSAPASENDDENGGGGFGFGRFRFPKPFPNATDKVGTKTTSNRVPAPTAAPNAEPAKSNETIRVASFHLTYFGATMADKEYVTDIVSRIVRRYDVVALQGVSHGSISAVAELVANVNKTGVKYGYIVGPPASVQHQDMEYAFVFDTQTIMTDRSELYTLGDPNDLLRREPLVAWFRARQAPPQDAFTFTLVNMHTDPAYLRQELGVLDDVMYEVRDDGRGEDDVIMLGCFNADDQSLGDLGSVPGLVAAIRGVPTSIDATRQTENILFRHPATDEFVASAGVFDFVRAYNTPTERAREVSDFFPVWAEFSIYEGGEQGRLANDSRERY